MKNKETVYVIEPEIKECKKLTVGKKVKISECYLVTEYGGGALVTPESIDEKEIEVEIIKNWYDYETGEHAKGKVLKKKIVEKLRKVGKSEYTPEYYRDNYGEEEYKAVLEAQARYNPEIVCISEWDLIEESEKK